MEQFLESTWPDHLKDWLENAFVWIGYATCVGLCAQFVVRTRLLRSPWTTFILGLVSVTASRYIVCAFWNVKNFEPNSPPGVIASILFALVGAAFCAAASALFPKVEDEDEFDEYDARADFEDDVEGDSRTAPTSREVRASFAREPRNAPRAR